MRILNLGILAHVDAGKTSLTERLLYEAGVTDRVGSVDAGTTRTDSLDIERRRGITIKSAVVSFTLPDPGGDDLVINVIDTPGHPDFIAEVERVLDVLDAVVLVVSAVEGVQPQTRVLTRALRRFGLPVVIFVNKIDRAGARPYAVVDEVRRRLELQPLVLGAVADVGTASARFVRLREDDARVRERWTETLADGDDELLAAWIDHRLTAAQLDASLRQQVIHADVQPLLFGSATTGAGVAALRETLLRLTPPNEEAELTAPVEARIFAVQRDPDRRRIVLARVRSGRLTVRSRVHLGEHATKITGLELVDAGTSSPVEEVTSGRIARIRGLHAARVGDVITAEPAPTVGHAHAFAPPALETIVRALAPDEGARLYTALSEMAEQDPLIDFRREVGGDLALSLYGEVQKEVIASTLLEEYGIETVFDRTRPICVEQVVGTGEAIVRLGADDNPILAGIGLRVEPTAPGAGSRYAVDGFMLGTMPPAFFVAVEETVQRSLERGLAGWRVIDAAVTLIHTGYYPRQSHAHATFDKSMSSTAGDFRRLTPLVLTAALRRARTRVLEPVHRFTLDLPEESITAALALITSRGGVPEQPVPYGPDWRLAGEVPAAAVHDIQQRLPGLSGGEAAWESAFSAYRAPSH